MIVVEFSSEVSVDSPSSSVVEHWSRKPGVRSSNLLWGFFLFLEFFTYASYV